jgi:hypothetical protein
VEQGVANDSRQYRTVQPRRNELTVPLLVDPIDEHVACVDLRETGGYGEFLHAVLGPEDVIETLLLRLVNEVHCRCEVATNIVLPHLPLGCSHVCRVAFQGQRPILVGTYRSDCAVELDSIGFANAQIFLAYDVI